MVEVERIILKHQPKRRRPFPQTFKKIDKVVLDELSQRWIDQNPASSPEYEHIALLLNDAASELASIGYDEHRNEIETIEAVATDLEYKIEDTEACVVIADDGAAVYELSESQIDEMSDNVTIFPEYFFRGTILPDLLYHFGIQRKIEVLENEIAKAKAEIENLNKMIEFLNEP